MVGDNYYVGNVNRIGNEKLVLVCHSASSELRRDLFFYYV